MNNITFITRDEAQSVNLSQEMSKFITQIISFKNIAVFELKEIDLDNVSKHYDGLDYFDALYFTTPELKSPV